MAFVKVQKTGGAGRRSLPAGLTVLKGSRGVYLNASMAKMIPVSKNTYCDVLVDEENSMIKINVFNPGLMTKEKLEYIKETHFLLYSYEKSKGTKQAYGISAKFPTSFSQQYFKLIQIENDVHGESTQLTFQKVNG